MCELLIHARIVTGEILFTRLPVGHTHEDIDSKFGMIWKACRSLLLDTPQKYKEKLEEVFAESDIKCAVVDVFAIPDYESWLEDYIDPEFHGWTKKTYTQLQWLFRPIFPSEYYPMAAITMYRGYCHDLAIEIVKSIAPHDTEIGAEIGLVAQQVKVRWLPEAKSTRPEGMFVLQGFPSEKLLPEAFVTDSRALLDRVVSSVKSEFLETTDAIAQWEIWASFHAPSSDDVYAYIANPTTALHRPLWPHFILSKRAFSQEESSTKHLTAIVCKGDRKYAREGMRMMTTGESVSWSGADVVQQPRIRVGTSDAEEALLKQRFEEYESRLVDYTLPSFTVDTLRKLLRSRNLTVSGNKSDLAQRLKHNDTVELDKR